MMVWGVDLEGFSGLVGSNMKGTLGGESFAISKN